MLEKLGAAGVPNIPTLICHGDLGQETELSKHWATLTRKRKSRRNARGTAATRVQPVRKAAIGRKSAVQTASQGTSVRSSSSVPEACPFQKLLHYRLVVAEVCFPLSEFKCGKQLISVVNDCILGKHWHSLQFEHVVLICSTCIAHWRAVESPERILHRDISTANILILPTVVADGETGQRRVVWKGVLTDWELSESLSDEYKTDVQGRPPHIVGLPHHVHSSFPH